MRALFIPLVVCLAVSANAQIALSVKAGFNQSYLHFPHKQGIYIVDSKGNSGWQAGLQADYSLKHWYLYAAPQVSQSNFNIHYFDFIVNADATYKPMYLTLPVGIGYRGAFNKALGFQLFGGLYAATGIAGNIKKAAISCGDERACTELPPPMYTNNKITYDNNSELAKTMVGLQVGAGLRIAKKIGVSLLYNRNFTNTFSKDMGGDVRISSLALDAQVQFAAFKRK